jgi:hypothetical protein
MQAISSQNVNTKKRTKRRTSLAIGLLYGSTERSLEIKSLADEDIVFHVVLKTEFTLEGGLSSHNIKASEPMCSILSEQAIQMLKSELNK